MHVPSASSIGWVLLWVVYVSGLVQIFAAVVFAWLLAWDELRYRRRRRTD